jgi:ABC-type glycerol-3-phosphate transport system substrate-binding protein
MKGSALVLVALLAGIAACSARRAQQSSLEGATGKPVEMSSMAITFYNSGELVCGALGWE